MCSSSSQLHNNFKHSVLSPGTGHILYRIGLGALFISSAGSGVTFTYLLTSSSNCIMNEREREIEN